MVTEYDERPVGIRFAEQFILLCKEHGIKHAKQDGLEIEFFSPKAADTDIPALSKVLVDSMPPDSSLLFAATEDISEPNEQKPYSEATENNDMKVGL